MELTLRIKDNVQHLLVIVWQLDLQLAVISVLITAKVVCSNFTHGEVYSIHYVIKFVSDFSGYSGFFHQYN